MPPENRVLMSWMGSTCLSMHTAISQVLLGVLFLFRVGDEPGFHVVVNHRAGEQAAALPLEQLQAFPQVEDDLVHVQGDAGQLLPRRRGRLLPLPGPFRQQIPRLFRVHGHRPFRSVFLLVYKDFPSLSNALRRGHSAIAFRGEVGYNSWQSAGLPRALSLWARPRLS